MGEFSWTGVTEVGCSSLLSGTVEIRGTIQQGLFLFFGFRDGWGTLALVFIFQQDDTFKMFHSTAVLHSPLTKYLPIFLIVLYLLVWTANKPGDKVSNVIRKETEVFKSLQHCWQQ